MMNTLTPVALEICIDCFDDSCGSESGASLPERPDLDVFNAEMNEHGELIEWFVNYGRACDGCGSMLGGSRFAVTGWGF